MYATQQDIIDRYSEEQLLLAFDRDGDGEVDENAAGENVAEKALSDASGEIDGYLSGRYSLPLPTTPSILTFFCVDIALYKGSVETAVTEEKRKRYEDAVKFLTFVSLGKVQLFASDPTAPSGGSGAAFSAEERIFTRNKMKDLR
jgi:phage gp36-like protein